MTPDYKRIYTDFLQKKMPSRYHEFEDILERKDLSTLDIIRLNQSIFGCTNIESKIFNQKHRSYNKAAILQILDYQKENKLNNSQLARHFNLSRNSVGKWKKLFLM